MSQIIKNMVHTLMGLLLAVGLIAPTQAEEVMYYHLDALGSPVAATDATGAVLWTESYEPFGERRERGDGGSNSQWYTGKAEDTAIGLNYFGARWYNSRTGRFTAMDPVGLVEENPQSFNRYAYANNNPYRFVDPDGREAEAVERTPGQQGLQRANNLGNQIFGGMETATEGASGFLIPGGVFTGILKKVGGNFLQKKLPLAQLGRPGAGKGVREVVGDVSDAKKLFKRLIGDNKANEVKSGVFVAKGKDGGNVTFRASSKSGPPTVDVHGVEKGVRKIKFVEK